MDTSFCFFGWNISLLGTVSVCFQSLQLTTTETFIFIVAHLEFQSEESVKEEKNNLKNNNSSKEVKTYSLLNVHHVLFLKEQERTRWITQQEAVCSVCSVPAWGSESGWETEKDTRSCRLRHMLLTACMSLLWKEGVAVGLCWLSSCWFWFCRALPRKWCSNQLFPLLFVGLQHQKTLGPPQADLKRIQRNREIFSKRLYFGIWNRAKSKEIAQQSTPSNQQSSQ